jgi:predicted alpha/beta hydrolase family esterase
MKKVLLLHGWGGSDFPHWQSWIAGELARNYGCVNFLRFSDVDTPKFETWMQELEEVLNDFRPDIVLCHSLANTLWFHIAAKKEFDTIEKLYLVAPPSLQCNIAELAEFFPVDTPKDLHAKEALLITSTNDPYMTNQEAEDLQKRLQIPRKIIKNGGHINADSGFGAWGWLLEDLEKICKN